MKDNKFGFGAVKEKLLQMKKELPRVLANDAQKFFVSRFTAQADVNNKPWQEVQRRIPGTKAYTYPITKGLTRRTKPILIGTGRLRREVNSSIRLATFEMIRLTVGDLPYAERHNEGLDRMPQRQYMGDSPILRAQQTTKIKQYISNLWPR